MQVGARLRVQDSAFDDGHDGFHGLDELGERVEDLVAELNRDTGRLQDACDWRSTNAFATPSRMVLRPFAPFANVLSGVASPAAESVAVPSMT
ncbi:MAG: hypothetical protein Q8S33_38320 [Myxococcales bacterium]|nr:hypothetical protein [Myxococcales bacterium]